MLNNVGGLQLDRISKIEWGLGGRSMGIGEIFHGKSPPLQLRTQQDQKT